VQPVGRTQTHKRAQAYTTAQSQSHTDRRACPADRISKILACVRADRNGSYSLAASIWHNKMGQAARNACNGHSST